MQRLYLSPRFRAFSLLELAVALVLSGLIAGIAIKLFEVDGRRECYTKTRQQMAQLQQEFSRYFMQNDRYPRPARRWVGINSGHSGREVLSTELAAVDVYTNTTGPNAGSEVLFGAIPWSTLSLSQEMGVDCWGNKLTYVVTKSLTEQGFNDETPGGIAVHHNDALIKQGFDGTGNPINGGPAGWAIISHGEDELGSTKANYEDMAALTDISKRKWCTPPGVIQLREQNCETSNSIVVESELNNGENAGTNYYDDIVTYRTKPWRKCSECCPMCALMPTILQTIDP